MAIVVSKSHKWRVLAAHVFLIGFIALMMFPLLMVVVISLRPGNSAVGSIIPERISFEQGAAFPSTMRPPTRRW